MSACTFDNPATMQRECWQNKELVCAYSAVFLSQVQRTYYPIFFGANIGPWKTGQIVGDVEAIKEDN